MSLWDWAVVAYARPGVEAACLDLQDRCGQSVSHLLWAAWAAGAGRWPEAPGEMARIALSWEIDVLRPLRQARRAMATGEWRKRAGALELEAERAMIEALEAATPAEGAALEPLAALTAAAKAFGDADPAALESLARALR